MSSDYPYLIRIPPHQRQLPHRLIFSFQAQNNQQSIQPTDIFGALFGTLQRIYLHPLKSYSTPFFLSSSESNAEGERLGRMLGHNRYPSGTMILGEEKLVSLKP